MVTANAILSFEDLFKDDDDDDDDDVLLKKGVT
jgi:hypothetical protein